MRSISAGSVVVRNNSRWPSTCRSISTHDWHMPSPMPSEGFGFNLWRLIEWQGTALATLFVGTPGAWRTPPAGSVSVIPSAASLGDLGRLRPLFFQRDGAGPAAMLARRYVPAQQFRQPGDVVLGPSTHEAGQEHGRTIPLAVIRGNLRCRRRRQVQEKIFARRRYPPLSAAKP